jgi:hypothetical protein
MEETVSQTQSQWSYTLLKNGACVAPATVRSSLVIGNEEGVLIRVQELSVSLFARGEPVNLAPCFYRPYRPNPNNHATTGKTVISQLYYGA